jgi:hypothetical protein
MQIADDHKEAARVANAIEEALFDKHNKAASNPYREQARIIAANLIDDKQVRGLSVLCVFV